MKPTIENLAGELIIGTLVLCAGAYLVLLWAIQSCNEEMADRPERE